MPRTVSAAATVSSVLLAAALSAGCTSSGSPKADAPSSTPATSATSSAAPTSTTPAPSSSSATSAAPPPLSPFEADPAVRALRLFGAEGARAITAGKVTTPAFDATMTPTLRPDAKLFTGDERGLRYPGPLPFTPVRVQVRSGTEREVRLCIVAQGFAVSPKTGKPVTKRAVQAIDATVVRQGGVWLVNTFEGASFSCAGVTIQEPTWSQS
ncbi:MAG: hypothetical protein ACTHMS_01945 [Jatrophihabitans sp.]|uniref:hypothetical protein n=1 Tax=Jatrophihabitans sp. TaxID=1932789 RepID=UPI003F7EA6F0